MPFVSKPTFRSLAVLAGVVLACGAHAAAAESRTYVRSWFGQAMYSEENDCPGGVNPPWSEQRLKDLADLGYSGAEIEQMVKDELAGGNNRGRINQIISMRGRVNGEPVNPYSFPATVVDPKLHAGGGRYAYGFNLDGRGAATKNGFEDPETHDKGVNNELARALGCMREFRGTLTSSPLYWDWTWGQLKDNEPAWLITIAGDDLGKDGDVTVTIDRALEHLKANTDGSARRDATYRVDPDPRSHQVYRGQLKNGVVNVAGPGIRMLQDPLVAMEFRMQNVRMRLKLKDDRTLETMIGGYQPWADLYYSFAGGGAGNESASTGDMPGIFYLFRKFADADPDETGQNASISATYYLQAIPAFVVPVAAPKMAKGQ
ncbi:MAG: hypothetical protein ACYCZX_02220 [Rhodospirillaceae bacterium]